MNRIKNIGLWVSILAVAALGIGPIISQSPSSRESILIILQAINRDYFFIG